jgi:hypothetical protein
MAPPRLHLDADTSMKALHTALVARGYDVTRTPETWMARDATDTDFCPGTCDRCSYGGMQTEITTKYLTEWTP